MEFTAAASEGETGQSTRSTLSGNDVIWQEGDRISIFDGTANNVFTISSGQGKAYGTFSGEAEEASEYLALYPYQIGASMDTGVIVASIPSTQTATANTYDPKAFLAAAITDDHKSLVFRNTCALLYFTSDADYTSATIRSLGGEALSGEIQITPSVSSPYIVLQNGTSPNTSVMLTGTIANGGNYFAAIRPQNLSQGIEMILANSNGERFRQEWGAKDILRNHSYNLGTVSPTQIYIDCSLSGPSSIITEGIAASFTITADSFTNNNLHSLVIECTSSPDGGNMTIGDFSPEFTADANKSYGSGTVPLTFSKPGDYTVRLTASEGTHSVSKSIDITVDSAIKTYYYDKTGHTISDPVEGVNTTFSCSGKDCKMALDINWNDNAVFEAKVTSWGNGYAFNIGDSEATTGSLIIGGYTDGKIWWRIEGYKSDIQQSPHIAPNIFITSLPIYIRLSAAGGLEYGSDGVSGVNWTTAIDPDDTTYLPALLNINPLYFGVYYKAGTPTFSYVKVTSGGGGPAPEPDPVESVSVSPSTKTIAVGENASLDATVSPGSAIQTVTWSSDNTNIATVNSTTGEVTGVAAGSCNIIATSTADGSKSGSCALTVTTVSVTGVSLDKDELALTVGSNKTLTETITPANATNKTVSWSSDDPSVATVSNGVVTGVAVGTATITVTTQDGNFTDECEVTVSAAPAPGDVTYLQGTDGTAANYFQPNGAKWTDEVYVDFEGGDYIEAEVDYTGHPNNVGNILSVGKNIEQWGSNQYPVYHMYISNGILCYANRDSKSNITKTYNPQVITIRVDSDGLKINGELIFNNDNGVITALAGLYPDTKVQIGSAEGFNRSSATYHYIKVVKGSSDPQSITITPSSLNLAPGDASTLSATVSPAKAVQTVNWSSNSADVTVNASTGAVSVSNSATVGSVCTITATSTEDANVYATCTVTIVEPSSDVILWQNYVSTTDPFSTTISVITSGIPDDDEINFTAGDYIDVKLVMPADTGEGMFLHVGEVGSSPWNSLKSIYVYLNYQKWANLCCRITNNSKGLNASGDPIYIYARIGYQDGCYISKDGTNWVHDDALDADFVSNVKTLTELIIGSSMMTGNGYLTRLSGITYEYVKIVRGSGD